MESWSKRFSPTARRRCASWLLRASSSRQVTVSPDSAMMTAGCDTAPSTTEYGDQIVDPDRRNAEQSRIGLAELENHVNRAGDHDRAKRCDGDAERVERAEQSAAHEQQRRPSDDHEEEKLGHRIGQLTGHQQRRLDHLDEIGHGGRDQLLLLVCGRLEAGEKTHYVMQIRAQLRIRRYADRATAPEAIARTHDLRSQQIASAIRFRPVLLE